MRDNRLPGVLAREKLKREGRNRGHWLVGSDRKSAAAARNMTKGVTWARRRRANS